MSSCESIGHRLSPLCSLERLQWASRARSSSHSLTHSARRDSLTPARTPGTRSPLSLGTPPPHQSRQGRQKIAPRFTGGGAPPHRDWVPSGTNDPVRMSSSRTGFLSIDTTPPPVRPPVSLDPLFHWPALPIAPPPGRSLPGYSRQSYPLPGSGQDLSRGFPCRRIGRMPVYAPSLSVACREPRRKPRMQRIRSRSCVAFGEGRCSMSWPAVTQ
jgi:hypothetical protein